MTDLDAWHDLSLEQLDRCAAEWAGDCQDCWQEAVKAAAAARKYGTTAIRIMCFADCKEDLEESVRAIDPGAVVSSVDGDSIIVLSHKQARQDFQAWCKRNVIYDD